MVRELAAGSKNMCFSQFSRWKLLFLAKIWPPKAARKFWGGARSGWGIFSYSRSPENILSTWRNLLHLSLTILGPLGSLLNPSQAMGAAIFTKSKKRFAVNYRVSNLKKRPRGGGGYSPFDAKH